MSATQEHQTEVLETLLDELRYAQTVADVAIAAGQARYGLAEVGQPRRRRQRLRLVAATMVVLASFVAISMMFHPGVQMDRMAAKII